MSVYAPEEDARPLPSPPAPSPLPSSSPTPTSTVSSARRSPDHLSKKRANDREAQRAIRERTKTQIETLERTIRELTDQQPYQELQQVIHQKEAVEAENQDIKRRLLAVLELIQPLIIGRNADDLHPSPYSNAAVSSSIPSSIPSPRTEIAVQDGSFNPSPNLPYPTIHSTHSHPSDPSMPTDSLQPLWQAAIDPISSLESSSTCIFAPHNSTERHTDSSGHEPTPATIATRSALGFLENEGQEPLIIGPTPEHRRQEPPLPADSHTTLTTSYLPASIQAYGPPILDRIPLAATLATVKHVPATCPLDDLLLKFVAERKMRAAEGVPLSELAEPADPDVSGMLRPERIPYLHPISRIMTDILGKFPSVSNLPERVVALYVMYVVLRWQVAPTQESYDRLPEWMRPTPVQLSVPHPIWIDYLAWLRIRDTIGADYHDYPFDDWFIPFTSSFSINWLYNDNDTVLSKPGSDEMTVAPLFEQHLRELNNWSVGPPVVKAFPTLAKYIRIETTPRRKAE